jgi:hypothetical protein
MIFSLVAQIPMYDKSERSYHSHFAKKDAGIME